MGNSNRLIKFRAWNITEKRFLTQKELDILTLWFINQPNNLILMQYTGLKDKNGKEIYEGDIIGSTGHTDGIDNSVIEYGEFNNNLGFYRKCIKHEDIYNDWGMSWHYEVIGNIYEEV